MTTTFKPPPAVKPLAAPTTELGRSLVHPSEPNGVDLNLLHLWMRTKMDRRTRLAINKTDMARQFGLTRGSMCRLLQRMEDQGRIRPAPGARLLSSSVATFEITDPAFWEPDVELPELEVAPTRRAIVWE